VNLQQAGQELGVGAILTGQVSQKDDLLTIQLDLLDVRLLVGDDSHRIPVYAGVAANQSLAVFGFVLVKLRAVDDARDDLFHVVLLGGIAVVDAVNLLGRIEWCLEFFVAVKWGRGAISHLVD